MRPTVMKLSSGSRARTALLNLLTGAGRPPSAIVLRGSLCGLQTQCTAVSPSSTPLPSLPLQPLGESLKPVTMR